MAFVVLLVLLIHKLIGPLRPHAVTRSILQHWRVLKVEELFKRASVLTASLTLWSQTALRHRFYHALVEMVTALLLLVQHATRPLLATDSLGQV
jgi:hypothetical protein